MIFLKLMVRNCIRYTIGILFASQVCALPPKFGFQESLNDHIQWGLSHYFKQCTFLILYLSLSKGLEYYLPFLVDICPPIVGVSYLDYSICTLVLYGFIAGTCHLCWVTSSCTICLWPSAHRWWAATSRSYRNIWLFWTWAEEVEIPMFAPWCSGKIFTFSNIIWSQWCDIF